MKCKRSSLAPSRPLCGFCCRSLCSNLLFGPWLLTLAIGRWWASSTDARQPRFARRMALLVCLSAFVPVALSVPSPTEKDTSKSFARDAVVNVATSEVDYEMLRTSIANASADLPDEKPPVDTHLVKTAHTQKRNVVLIHLESTRAESVTP